MAAHNMRREGNHEAMPAWLLAALAVGAVTAIGAARLGAAQPLVIRIGW